MTLSFADAIAELTDPANAAKYSTYDGLIELTKRVSVTVPGQAANALTIQYSNTLTAGGIKTEALALAFSDALGGQVRVINRTPLAEFLTSDQFIAKAQTATRILNPGFTIAQVESATRTNFLFEPATGPWAEGSRNFMASAPGDTISLAPRADPLRTAAIVENVESLRTAATQSMSLADKALLDKVYSDALARDGAAVATEKLNNAMRFLSATNVLSEISYSTSIAPDGSTKLNIDTGNLLSKLGLGGAADVHNIPAGQAKTSWLSALNDYSYPEKAQMTEAAKSLVDAAKALGFTPTNGSLRFVNAGNTTLNGLGVAAVGVSLGVSLAQAQELAEAGQVEAAQALMLKWTAQMEAGIGTGAAAVSLFAPFALPLLAAGPLGGLGYVAALAAVGIGSGFVGSEAVGALIGIYNGTLPTLTQIAAGGVRITQYSNGVEYAKRDLSLPDAVSGRVEESWLIPMSSGRYTFITRYNDGTPVRIESWSGLLSQGGRILSKVDVKAASDGASITATAYEPDANGQFVQVDKKQLNAAFDGSSVVGKLGQNDTVVSTSRVVPDGIEGSLGRTVTTEFIDGRKSIEVHSTTGHVLSVTEIIPSGADGDASHIDTTTFTNGNKTIAVYDAAGALYRRTEQTLVANGSLQTQIFDGTGTLLSTATRVTDDQGSYTEVTYDFAAHKTTTVVVDSEGALVSSSEVPNSTGSSTLANLTGPGSSFIDSLSLIRAIQSGQPLPIAASGLRLASGLDALINTPAQANLILSGASAAASGILSIISLERSLQRGDALGALSAGGQALNFAADAYLKLAAEGLIDGAGNVAAAQLRDILSGTSTQIFDDGTSLVTSFDATGGVLPYLNLALSIRDGNPVGIASAVLAFIPGGQPIALALQAFQLIDGLFGGGSGGGGQLPDTYGNANLYFTGSALTPGITYNAYGTESAGPMLGSLLGQMNTVLANAQAASPTHPLGLIPMRMPNLSVTRNPYTHLAQWRITDINPLTGAANHPGAFYDDSGRNYGSIDGPEALQSLSERFIRSSLAREAIAPLWEVQTAFLRNALGDPNAGYTEEETAARLGKQGVDPNTLPTLSRLGFRPILLDLNGDNVFSTYNLVPTGQTGTTTNPAHAFDAQDDGYLRSTGWVKSSEGILVLDRNLNGTIDSGREVFSNGKVNDASKGSASLAWVDANLDGVIDSNDPVFNELQVWVDANGNNQSDVGELSKLTALGITALNYAGNTFTHGVTGAGGTVTLTTGLMASPDLAAERDGTQQTLISEGLLIQSSNGTLSLIVNNVQDLSGGGGGGTAGLDGLTGLEDAQLIVGAGDLTQNDVVGGIRGNGVGGIPGTLTVTGVSNAQHGTVALVNGVITYTPEANWFTEKQTYNPDRTEVKDAAGNTIFTHVAGREAGFDYSVTASNGATATFHADVAVKNVNDKPVVSVVPQTRDVYGTLYTLSPQDYSIGGEDYSIPVAIITSQIQYAPFVQPAIPGGVYAIFDGENYSLNPNIPGAVNNTVAYLEPLNNNRGQVRVTDADGPNQTYTFSASYGSFGQGVVRSYGSYAEYGYINWSYPGVPGADFAAFSGYGGDGFLVSVTDEAGGAATAGIGVLHAGGYGGCAGSGGCNGAYYSGPFWPQPPLVVDIDGNGFSFKQSLDGEAVYFDTLGDGFAHRTSWIKPGDGFIAYDLDGDSKISSAGELQFASYSRGAATDLEGLRAFDTNGDGLLSALDAGWSKFGIWQDANSNGISEAGEFRSMTALGVASLNLAAVAGLEIVDGQAIYGKTTLTYTNGQTRAVADVGLTSSDEVRVNVNNAQTGLTQTLTAVRNSFAGAGEVTNYGAGNNLILGKPGSNTSIAGDGDNVVYDDGGDDGVLLGNGNNVVFTGTGADVVVLGNGGNAVFAGEGNDIVLAGNGNNALLSEGGNDVILAGNGNNLIAGGDGNDLIRAGDGVNQLFGGNGRDVLFSGNGGSQLFGGAGDDELNAGSASDFLDGGSGGDTMAGGAGDDTYVVDDTRDVIVEAADVNGVAAGVDTVRASIDYTLGANLENLTLTGSARNGAGNTLNNLLIGTDGDNQLAGFGGNDVLRAGLGNDVYVFCKGDGQDVIDDAGGAMDILRFRTCASPSEIVVSREATGLRFNITTTGDSVLVKWDPANGVGIERVEFPRDGTVWDKAMLDDWANRAPVAGAPLAAQTATDDTAFRYTVPLAAFSDPDYADALTYSAHLADGSALPAWLTFNAATRSFGGTPDDANVGALAITIRATDTRGLAVEQALNLTVLNANDAPLLAAALANQTATQDAAFSFTLPSGAFTDADARFGDTLRYAATRADGMPLPAWLAFDAATRTLHGTPANADVADFSVRITATDLAGASAAALFGLHVENVNDAPLAFADNAAVREDLLVAASGNVLANDTDIDAGTVLQVTSTGSFTGTYGTLTVAADGAYAYALNNGAASVQALAAGQQVSEVFAYAVKDNDLAAPLTAASTLTITITGTNDAPVVTADTAVAREDVTLSAGGNVLLNDSDADQGAVLAVLNPGVITGTYGSLTLTAGGAYTYTLSNSTLAVQALRGGEAVTDVFGYAASDGTLSTASTITVTVLGKNDAPVTQNDSAAVGEDAVLTATGNVLANDSDIDRGTVLTIAAPGTYTGTYGVLTLAASGAYTYTLSNASTVVQSLAAGQGVTDSFAYQARDNDASPLQTGATLAVSVTGANDAPVLAQTLAAQNGREAQALSFTLPATAFTDADQGDRLSYSVQFIGTDGVARALPSWLSFNAATRSFSGTPAKTDGGSYQIRVTATDLAGASASSTFALTILDSFANGAVITSSAAGDTLNGTDANETLNGQGGSDRLFAGAGSDTLSGGSGSDLLDAGAGDDTLRFGADAYWGKHDYVQDVGSPGVAGSGATADLDDLGRSWDVFIGGAGRDTLMGTAQADAIILDDASSPSALAGPRLQEIELINAGDGDDVVDLTSSRYSYGDITIDGGNGNDTVWSSGGNDALFGGAGSDTLNAGAGRDTLDGGSGSDTLVGGLGGDTYLLGRGYGNDTIAENDANQAGAANTDVARFLSGISANQLWFRKAGNDLEVQVIGTADKFTIDRWYKGAQYRVEQFQTTDGNKTLMESQVQNLVNAMAAFAPPAAGQTSLSSSTAAALNPVIAANWQ